MGVLEKRGDNMEIKNDIIKEPLCIDNIKMLYSQLREIDSLTGKEEVSTLIDKNGKCLIINRCVHPNIFIINYAISGSNEREITITESEIHES